MQIDQLRAFLVVAEEPSLRRAATRLHLSQPALSERMLRLEQALGVCLLERRATGCTLTPDGERLLPLVRDAVRAVDAVLSSTGEGPAGSARVQSTVRIGIHADGIEELTWPVVQAVRSWAPEPRVLLAPVTWTECVPAVTGGGVDAVLVRGPFAEARVAVTTLAWSPVGVLLSSRHELADAPVLDPVAVAQAPTLRPPGLDPTYRAFWLQEDVNPDRRVLGGVDTSVRELVRTAESTGAVGLFPARLARTALRAGAVFRPLSEDVRCPLQVLTRPGSATGRGLAATARAVAERLVPLLPHLRPHAEPAAG